MIEFTAAQIAEALKGEVVGNADVKLRDVAKIEEGREGALSFLANPKYIHYIYTTKSSAVLVNRDFKPEEPVQTTLIYVDNAYEAFASLLDMVAEAVIPRKNGIEQPSFIDPSATYGEGLYLGAFAYIGPNAKIGKNVKIYPQCYIGDNVKIGDNCIIYPGVKIYYNCVLGNNVTLHAGVSIGADGFGFAPNADNNYKKIPQIGNVIIEDYVEIGANTCVDRSTMGSTIIHKGVKLDNLVQVGHNVQIGENTVMSAQCGIAGSTKIGRNCMCGGQVGFAPHISVADGTHIGAQSGLNSTIKTEGTTIIGSPVQDYQGWLRSYVVFRKLPEIAKRLDNVEKQLKA